VVAAARAEGIPEDWIEAARRSPVYALTNRYRIALPLHPEYRTMPMVWYIPPLSPVVDAVSSTGADGEDKDTLFAAIDQLRIPVEYLAEVFTAGDPEPVENSLRILAAMRSYMRRINLGEERDESIATAVGMTGRTIEELYRLLAIAKYEDRYVIPAAHVEAGRALDEIAGCSLDYSGGPGMGSTGAFGEVSSTPASVETFQLTKQRAEADRYDDLPEGQGAVDLLTWSGGEPPAGMFPPRREPDEEEPS
jgi:nitrate reductase beta subunit